MEGYFLRRPRTLRQWSALLMAVCLLPATVATLLLAYQSYQRERVQLEQATLQTARALVLAVDRELAGMEAALRVLSTSVLLQSGQMHAFDAQAREALHSLGAGAYITVSDAAGRQLLNTRQPRGAAVPPGDGAAQARAVFAAGRTVVSGVSRLPAQQGHVISIGVPVRQDRRIVYALSLVVPAGQVGDILKLQRVPATWPVAILDDSGVIVARSMEGPRFVGQQAIPALKQRVAQDIEGKLKAQTLEGIPALISYSRSPVSGWAVAIAIPEAELLLQLTRAIAWTVLGALLLWLACLVLISRIGEQVARSIRALAGPAMALGYGQPVRVGSLPLREANEVGHALGQASELLQARTAERDLAEQTAEALRSAKQQLEYNETLQRAIFEQAPDALLLVAPHGRIVRANEQAAILFGYSAQALLAMTVEDLVPQAMRERHTALRLAYQAAPSRRPMGSAATLSARRNDATSFPVDIMLSPLRGLPAELVMVTVRDITARRHDEDALRESEKRFRLTMEHAPIGMAVVALDGRWMEVNAAMCELLGYDRTALLGLRFQDVTHPEDLQADMAFASRLLSGEIRSYQMEKRYIRRDGVTVQAMLTGSVVRDDSGRPLHFIAQVEDITVRKRAQQQLATLNKRLALATRAGGMGVWEFDIEARLLWWDDQMYALYGMRPAEAPDLYQAWRSRVDPADLGRVEALFEEAVRHGAPYATQFAILLPDGGRRMISANGVLSLDDRGEPVCMTGINWDVTESLQREQAIRAALEEKNTLLRELYHRVKNNLQVITSLLTLQARALADRAARLALQEGADRVRAMALVHEKLYQSKNLSSIALDAYIDDLCRQLGNAAAAKARGIAIDTAAIGVEVSLQTAVPLGLILNELVANCLRHAFPDARHGRITVRLDRTENAVLQLTVADDGVGLPPGSDPGKSHTLGLKLAHALAGQLDGRFFIEGGKGTTARLTFPAKEAGARAAPAALSTA